MLAGHLLAEAEDILKPQKAGQGSSLPRQIAVDSPNRTESSHREPFISAQRRHIIGPSLLLWPLLLSWGNIPELSWGFLRQLLNPFWQVLQGRCQLRTGSRVMWDL